MQKFVIFLEKLHFCYQFRFAKFAVISIPSIVLETDFEYVDKFRWYKVLKYFKFTKEDSQQSLVLYMKMFAPRKST